MQQQNILNIIKNISSLLEENLKYSRKTVNHTLTSDECILCYNLQVFPQENLQVHIQISITKTCQICTKFITNIEPIQIATEQLVDMINKKNQDCVVHHTFLICYCSEKKELEGKTTFDTQSISKFGNIFRFEELTELLVKGLEKYEIFLKEIYLNAKGGLPEMKKRTKSLIYVIKIKNYVDERIAKQLKYNPVEPENKEIVYHQNKNILNDQFFIKFLKDTSKLIFEEAYSQQKQSKILRKIKLNNMERCQEWTPNAHSFGVITKYYAEFEISNGSIHSETNEHIKNEIFTRCEGYLVEKQTKEDEESMLSFETEMGVLMFLKEKECLYIGEYFMEQTGSQNDLKKLYSYFYPGSANKFAYESFNGSKKLSFLSGLAIGIGFLSNCDIMHRDLKPANIVLDRKQNPRIIDFGSSIHKKPYSIKRRINYELRTTVNYNYTYEDLPETVQEKVFKEEFEKHENFDMFAYGKILEEVAFGKEFELQIGEYFYEILMWAHGKCTELDPNKRIHPKELTILMKLVLKSFVEILGEKKN